jgi:hypothetical protein
VAGNFTFYLRKEEENNNMATAQTILVRVWQMAKHCNLPSEICKVTRYKET